MGNSISSSILGRLETFADDVTAVWSDISNRKRLKPQSSTVAADTSLIFSDDLLLEIFLRLPHAQSLLRCTAVCKRWRHLVSSEGFGKRFNLYHRNNDSPPPYTLVIKYVFDTCHVVFSERSSALHAADSRGLPGYLDFVPPMPKSLPPFVHYVPMPPKYVPEIIASCEDLLLIKRVEIYTKRIIEYFLCNPLTRQAARLPLPSAVLAASYALTSATNGTTGNTCFYVFRFRHSTAQVGPGAVFTYDLFCTDTGVWDLGTVAVSRVPNSVIFYPKGSAFMTRNGVMHVPIFWGCQYYHGLFLAFDPFSAEEPKRGRLVSPGLETERRQSVCIERNFFWGLNEGRLRLTHCFGRKRAFLKIWELSYDNDNDNDDDNDNGNGSWVVIHSAEVERLADAKDMCVKGFHPNDGNVVFVVNNREDIYEYHFVKQEYRKVGQITSELCQVLNRRYYSLVMKSYSLVYPAWPTPVNQLIAN